MSEGGVCIFCISSTGGVYRTGHPHAAIQSHACWYVVRVHVEDTILLYCSILLQATVQYTLKIQTMAVACPWILGSRLSIILSAQAASLGECEHAFGGSWG